MFGETREFSDAEIASILSRTQIPTVVIEGKGDLFLFRRIQQEVGVSCISTFAVGGRSRVIFAYRNRPNRENSPPVLFFSDKDEWEFSETPQEFDDAAFETTDGYSIENDLIRDGSSLESLYDDERTRFDADLNKFCDWFSIQMARFLRGEGADLKKFPSRILDSQEEFDGDCALAEGEGYPADIREKLRVDPLKSARGKSLIQILSRQLNAPGRDARYNPKAILEAGAAAKGERYQRVLNWVLSSI